MSDGKGKGQGSTGPENVDALPSYEESSTPGPSAPGPSASTYNPDAKGLAASQQQHSGPTVDSPFDFPTEASAPPYSAYSEASSSSSTRKPIAIPQQQPGPAAPFLAAYAPVLLSHGIPADSWRSFMKTVSAFLSAKVSERALAHVADIGKELGQTPKSFGKGTAKHAMSIGRGIKQQAKEGNIIGAAMGVVGGAVSLPVGTALRAVGAVATMPGWAIAAATKKPLTPRERAAAYIATANKDWLSRRGLRAELQDTTEVAKLVGLQPEAFLGLTNTAKDTSGKLLALAGHIAELDVAPSELLELNAASLWVVITEKTGPVEKAT